MLRRRHLQRIRRPTIPVDFLHTPALQGTPIHGRASGAQLDDPNYPHYRHRRKRAALRIRPGLRTWRAERQQGVHGCSPSVQCPRQPLLAGGCAHAADRSGRKEGRRGWCSESRCETLPDARGEPPRRGRAIRPVGAQGRGEAEAAPHKLAAGSVPAASPGGEAPTRTGEAGQAIARADRRLTNVLQTTCPSIISESGAHASGISVAEAKHRSSVYADI